MNQDPEGIEQTVLNQLVELAGSTVLEVGSGDGRLVRMIDRTAHRVFGVDPDITAIVDAVRTQPAATDGKTHYAAAMCEELPFIDKLFDGVIFGWSL